MNAYIRVFLGGTCGANPWRETLVIPALLSCGVAPSQIYNPVVPHWDTLVQAREDAIKADLGTLLVFVLASPDPGRAEVTQISGYSLAETIMALYDAPARTGVCFQTTGFARRTAKGLCKVEQDVRERFPGAPIFCEYAALIEWIATRLSQERSNQYGTL